MQTKKISAKQAERIQQALMLHYAGRFSEAEAQYRNLLKLFPQHPQLLAGMGTLALQQENYAEAEKFLSRSLAVMKRQPNVHCNLGTALVKLNKFDAALRNFDQAIALDPGSALAYNNRGSILHQLQNFQAALGNFDDAIAIDSNYAEAYYNRGLVLEDMGRFSEALGNFQNAISLKPDYAKAYFNLGNVLINLDRIADAVTSYGLALNYKPDYLEAFVNRGNLLKDLKRFPEAIEHLQQALALDPESAMIHYNLGLAYYDSYQYDKALGYYETAISLAPDLVEAYNNLGRVLQQLNQYQAAFDNYETALAIDPHDIIAINNLGTLYKDMQKLAEAEASYQLAIELKPDDPDAYWNISLVKLLSGNYLEGWRLYEWRWQTEYKKDISRFQQPVWLGEENINGKTLLVYPEQGYGDFIQFCRYVALLQDAGARVVLGCPKPLLSLLTTLKGPVTLIEKGQQLPDFDLQCPIMSLPLAFQTRLENIPTAIPYLYADADKQQGWQQQLGNDKRIKIGLVWSGSTTHKNDFNRSIPVELLAPLLALPVEFHCLQKEVRPEDVAKIAALSQMQLHQESLEDFSDTAALISVMDLVISVDTSVAHLTGALGKPVWILLQYAPDYRWLLHKNDSPWYPTATLFRQTSPGDWSEVIMALVARLSSPNQITKFKPVLLPQSSDSGSTTFGG